MIKNSSLTNQLLFYVLALIVIAMTVLFYFSYSDLKSKVDASQERLYNEKIDNIIYLINEKHEKLRKTGMVSAYEEAFKKGTIKSVKEVFDKNLNDEYPFIINENMTFILHRTFNLTNKEKYKDDISFLKVFNHREGSFDLLDSKKDRWVIFKYYEPWGWIVGYRVHKDLKYNELNEYRDNFLISALLFLIAVFFSITIIVRKVLEPIYELTNVSKKIASGDLETTIEVFGAKELKELASNFKVMRDKISEDFQIIKESDEKLKDFNKNLQIEVEERTRQLQESNDELETSIENLRKTQNKLIESEKLAGLGSLVAGVAHEVNTPVGIGLTGSSHLSLLNETINEKYKNDQMSKENFEEYLKSSSDMVNVINSNLERTAEIIKNFKQVAVDQTSEQKRVFRVKEYIRGILVSIDSIIKKKDTDVTIDCDESLEIVSYPGFYAQIITNLVSNSVIHGFDKKEKGQISISIKKDTDELITLIYRDDGVGISERNLSKIYEPFYSTNKEAGGSGLGLNIVYNLVTINLKGTIDCKSEVNKGTTFTIKLPI